MLGLPIDDHIRTCTGEKRKITVASVIAILAVIIFFSTNLYNSLKISLTSIDESICKLHDIKAPESFFQDNTTVLSILHDPNYRKRSIKTLAGAIKVDTQIVDNQPDVPDAPEVWEKFQKFHEYLESTYADVYEALDVQKVNTYALVFYWEGSNPDLKPLMLTAHQDTVHVQKDTLKDWTYPPFEGHYDGEYIYGRGATDCKNVLTAILDTLKIYVNEGYKPERGIVVAFGFDEEASGLVSATALAKHLEKRFGKDSMYAIIDEGPGITIDGMTQRIIATPGTGEKGYIDIQVEIITPGGHSSIPPDHTSIGILSELAYIIEKDQYQPILTSKNPTLGNIQCAAIHSGNSISKYMKKAILRAGYDKFANSKVVKMLHDNLLTRYLIQTSQGVDIISGGEKANALPEEAKMVVNHRIAIESSVDEVKQHFVSRVLEVAKRHNLGVHAFGETLLEGDGKSGNFKVDAFSKSLEPAPTTPIDDKVWSYLAGVTRHIFEGLVFQDIDYPIITTPAIMTGNTDTRHYWNLTNHIFRYSPFFVENLLHDTNAHSVDEKLKFDGHLQLTAFFYEYIKAIDTKKAG